MKKTKLRKVLPVIVFLMAFAVFVGIILSSLNPRKKSYDSRRVGDIKQLQLAFELYAETNKTLLPPIPEGCLNINVLEEHLVTEENTILASLPKELKSGHPEYQVAISSDRKNYVLKATMENKGDYYRHVLEDPQDKDGQIMGCNCDDPNYCASLALFSP